MLTYAPRLQDTAEKTSRIVSWLTLIQASIAAWSEHRPTRLPRELSKLSDDMLLDIGVDPRQVPNPAGDLFPRPDLTRSGLATPIWRTTAR